MKKINIFLILIICFSSFSQTVTNVTSTKVDGTYGVGDIIPITITFNTEVIVQGTPQLTIETGTTDAVVDYSGGGGETLTLIFNYTVLSGHISNDLDYVNSNSLSLNGGTIRESGGNDATLTLASPGAANSLGANKDLVVDTTVSTITM